MVGSGEEIITKFCFMINLDDYNSRVYGRHLYLYYLLIKVIGSGQS